MGGFVPTLEVWQNREHALTHASEKVEDKVTDHGSIRLILAL